MAMDIELNFDSNSYGLMNGVKNRPKSSTTTKPTTRALITPEIPDSSIEHNPKMDEILPENPLQTWGFNTPVNFKASDDDKRLIEGEYNKDSDSLDLNVKGDKIVHVDITGLKEEIKEENKLVWEPF